MVSPNYRSCRPNRRLGCGSGDRPGQNAVFGHLIGHCLQRAVFFNHLLQELLKEGIVLAVRIVAGAVLGDAV